MQSSALLALIGFLSLSALAGCGPQRPEPDETAAAGAGGTATAASPSSPSNSSNPSDTANDAEWAWLQKASQTLGQKRAELASATSPETPRTPAAAEQTRQLQKEVDDLAAELNRRLVELINADPPIVGQPLTERQQSALRMKSGEDILIGRDFIERGGDYRRAIEIYEAALLVDPGNPRLQEELERARGERYMSAERFAQVKEGMSEDEVRGVLGQANLHNVREYAQKGVTAWFYPKDSGGAAAAVYFEKQNGKLKVYAANFDAVSPDASAAPAEPPA